MANETQPAARTGVFISHAHDDEDLARSLCQLLESALGVKPGDITCTSDEKYGLHRGSDLSDEIHQRLNAAKALFLLATRRSKGKDWVQYECGYSAPARERGDMKFYVLTPTVDDRDAVPNPYKSNISVTMSNGGDTWAFLQQLRSDLGQVSGGDLSACTAALLDLQSQCAKLERDDIEAHHQQEAKQARRRSRLAIAAGWVVAASMVGGLWFHFAAERETIVSTLTEQNAKEQSEQLMAFEAARDDELRKIPFSGFFRGPGPQPLLCSKVEAELQDRTIQTDCGGDGVFVFKGSELQSDPMARIQMIVYIGSTKRRTVVDRGSVPVAISLTGGF